VNMIVWWFALMIPAWLILAWILWKTPLVFSGEEGTEDEEGRRVEHE
jgi:hypothetical protein